MKKSVSPAVSLLSTVAGLCLSAAALSPAALAQTTTTYSDTEISTTDQSTTAANPLTVTIASGVARENGEISGDGTLTKTGDGTLTLGATNTYSGGTFLTAGTLELYATDALGTGTIIISGGGIRAGGAPRTLTNALATSGSFTVGRATNFAGAMNLTAATTIAASNPDGLANDNTSFNGVISGGTTGGLTLAEGAGAAGIGTGYIVFTNANTYTGGTTLRTRLSITSDAALGASSGSLTMEGGTLRGTASINSSRTILLNSGGGTFDLSDPSSFSGIISGSGALTKSGTGTLTLSGNNTFTGGATVSAGTLRATTSSSALGAGTGTGALTVSGTGAVELANNTGLNFGRNTTVSASTANFTSDVLTTGNAGVTHTLGALSIGAHNLVLNKGANVGSGVAGLTFGDVILGASGATLTAGSGTQLTLGSVFGDGRSFTVAGEGNTAITGNIATGSGTLTKNGAGTLTLFGSNDYTGGTTISGGTLQVGNGGTSGTLPANVVNNAALIFNRSNVSTYSGVISGSGSVTKAGAGTLTLTNANTYSGVTTLTGGTLQISGGSALPDTTAVTLGNNASTSLALAASETIGSLAGGGATGGNVSLGAFTLTSGGNDASTTFAGAISGTGGLVKTGSGTLTLSAANTYTGTTTVSAGTLRATTSASALGGGSNNLTLSGSGKVELANDTGLNFGRNTAVSATTANFTSDVLTNGNAGVTHTLGTLSIGGGNLILNQGANVGSGVAGLTFGTVTLNASGTTFTAGSGTQLTLGAVTAGFSVGRSFTVTGEGNTAITGEVSASSVMLTKSGTGTLTLSAANTYTTTVSAGTLRATTSASALGGAINTLTLSGSGTVELANDTGLNFGRNTTVSASTANFTSDVLTNGYAGVTHTLGTLSIGAHNLILNQGTNVGSGVAGLTFGAVTLNASGATFTPGGGTLLTLGAVNGATRDFTVAGEGNTAISGQISTTTGTVTKSGSGTLTLSGANTYTGATTVAAGTLQLAKADSLLASNWTPAKLIVNSGATLALNVGGTGEFTSANVDTLKGLGSSTGGLSNGSILGLDTSNATGGAFTYGGIIADTNSGANVLGLVKLGSGTLTLSGNNSYTGGTTVASGTLALAGNNALGTATAGTTVASGGTLGLSVNYTTAEAVRLSGTGAAGRNGALDNLSGDNTFAGPLILAGNAQVAAAAGTTLTLSGGFTEMGGARTLTFAGAGTTVLTGPASHTGGTTIASGIVTVDTGGSLSAANTRLTITGGTLNLNGHSVSQLSGTAGTLNLGSGTPFIANQATNSSFAGTLAGASGFFKFGGGTLTLAGSNVHTGGTSILGGTLRATTSATALGTGGLDVSGLGMLELANDTGLDFGRNTTVSADTANFTSDVLTNGNAGVTHTLGTLLISNDNLILKKGANVGSGIAGLTFGTVTLSASGATFTANSGTQLTLGAVSGGGHSFTVDGAGNTAITGVISTTSGTLTKSGTGTLTLSDANTYTGATTVSAGTLVATANNALGTAAAGTTVASGATLGLSGGFNYTTAEIVTLSGTGATGRNGALDNLDGNNTFAGPVRLAGNASVGASSGTMLTLSGGFTETGGSRTLTFAGNGTTVLTAAATYTGATTVSSGTVVAAANSALGTAAAGTTVSSGATLGLSGGFNYTTAEAVTLSGTGAAGRNGALDNLAGNNAFAGPLVLAGNTQVGAASGTTLTLSGGLTETGGARTLTFAGAGTTVLTGTAAHTGGTMIASGIVTVNTGGTLSSPAAPLAVTGGTLNLNVSQTVSQLGGAAGTLNLGSGRTLTVNQASNSTFTGTLAGAGGLTKSGAGTLTLQNVAFSGPLTLNGGRLNVSGSVGALTVNSGATLSPGNSPGTLASGDATWNGGGGLLWEINHATGAAGTNWDVLAVSGTLTINATTETPFAINVLSLTSGDVAGLLGGLTPGQTYTWEIATATGGIIDFSTGKFALNTTQFTDANPNVGGTFSLQLGDGILNNAPGSSLDLVYLAIPEPSSYAALAGGLTLALALTRRRRHCR